MLKAIHHAQEDARAAREKALQVVEKLRAMRLAKAAEIVATASTKRSATMPCRQNTGAA